MYMAAPAPENAPIDLVYYAVISSCHYNNVSLTGDCRRGALPGASCFTGQFVVPLYDVIARVGSVDDGGTKQEDTPYREGKGDRRRWTAASH